MCLKGSDIETLGSEAVVEYRGKLFERLPVDETTLQDIKPSASAGKNLNLIVGVALVRCPTMGYDLLYVSQKDLFHGRKFNWVVIATAVLQDEK